MAHLIQERVLKSSLWLQKKISKMRETNKEANGKTSTKAKNGMGCLGEFTTAVNDHWQIY